MIQAVAAALRMPNRWIGWGMASYFHFAPILLAPGSIIEPGNFNRIIRRHGPAHNLYRREMAYEDVRQQLFSSRPSRLDCLFCFPTMVEAELCRAHINGYVDSILYDVESNEASPHLADMNNGLQNFTQPAFDNNVIAYYWRGWQRSPDPQAVILREVLLRSAVTVRRRL
jgi:hypothetical protein